MTKNIAHRGFSSKYPENTLLAFSKALEVGVDGMEFDVQLTKDNVAIIMHDELLDRVTLVSGFVKDKTYAELLELNAAAYMPNQPAQKIPTLEQYFQLIEGHKVISNIELKTSIINYEGIEQIVYDLMKKYNRIDDVIISSFNHYTCKRFKAMAPEVKCGFLEGSVIVDFEQYAKANGMDCVHPFFTQPSPQTMKVAKQLGLEVNVWACDFDFYMDILLQLGVDGVITDVPDLFNERRKMFLSKQQAAK